MTRTSDRSKERQSEARLGVRAFHATDQAAVEALHRSALEAEGAWLGNGPWDDDLRDIAESYLGPGATFYVGTIGHAIVAMGALRPFMSGVGEIKRMRVSPEHQRQGCGQVILDALEKTARDFGYRKIVLDTTVRQLSAQQFYLKNGYVETRRTKSGFPIETIVYEKTFS